MATGAAKCEKNFAWLILVTFKSIFFKFLNLTPIFCQKCQQTFLRLLAFSTWSRLQNTDVNRKSELEVVFAAVLAKILKI